jgi:hypothetical protein
MKKQTAVEWLIARFHYEGFIGTFCSEEQIKAKRDVMIEIIEQAKEMEKAQIMTAFTRGDIFGADYFDGVNITEENYYKQTYESNT